MQHGIIIYQWTGSSFSPWHAQEQIAHTFDQAQMFLPEGVYTTFRTYRRNQAVRLDAHFQRLEDSARLLGCEISLDRKPLRAGLAHLIDHYGYPDSRLRLSVDLTSMPGSIHAMVELLKTPTPEDYAQGVSAVTHRDQRDQPKAKSTHFIHQAAEMRQEANDDVNEVLMVSQDGRLLEGLSSNFFAISAGEAWTEDEGVLSGVTRSLVLDVLRKECIPLRLEGFPAGQLDSLDEAFITSSSRGVLPVCQIDHRDIGDGKPGPLTLRIRESFDRLLDELLESIAGK